MIMETHIEFTTEPIIVPAAQLMTRETGAEVEFRGIVRETERGRMIAGLNYEAYVPMVDKQIRRIVTELQKTWPCQAVWFIHRLGWVPAGEASLHIRVHASHRGAAFKFCMELIDLLKKDVPIWKAAATPVTAAEVPSP
jgi:molybdopterin synthase catalytic subunit